MGKKRTVMEQIFHYTILEKKLSENHSDMVQIMSIYQVDLSVFSEC